MKKSLQEWKAEIDIVMEDIVKMKMKLGEKMFFARTDLNFEEYEELREYLKKAYRVLEADLKANVAAFLYTQPDLGPKGCKRLNPKLVNSGARNSKVLAMEQEVQDRILSGEPFPVVKQNGKTEMKPWDDMTDWQRNHFLDKGGNILSIEDQLANLSGERPNTLIMPLVKIDNVDGVLMFRGKDQNIFIKTRQKKLIELLTLALAWPLNPNVGEDMGK